MRNVWMLVVAIMACSLVVSAEINQPEEKKTEPKAVDYTMGKDTSTVENTAEQKEEAPAPKGEARKTETPVQPAETAPAATVEMKIGTGVVNRELQGEGSSFSKDIGTVSCWTLVKGALPGSKIIHEWSLDGNKAFEIPLEVKSARSRTWSTKAVTSAGNWSVKALDEAGRELGSVSFEVK